MKTVAITLAFILCSSAYAASRGSRCQDQACWNMERARWQESLAVADAHYSSRVGHMLARWTALGFPSDYPAKAYAHIHNQFLHEVSAAGHRWFFETEGYDTTTEQALEAVIVQDTELNIDDAVIGSWLHDGSQW